MEFCLNSSWRTVDLLLGEHVLVGSITDGKITYVGTQIFHRSMFFHPFMSFHSTSPQVKKCIRWNASLYSKTEFVNLLGSITKLMPCFFFLFLFFNPFLIFTFKKFRITISSFPHVFETEKYARWQSINGKRFHISRQRQRPQKGGKGVGVKGKQRCNNDNSWKFRKFKNLDGIRK